MLLHVCYVLFFTEFLSFSNGQSTLGLRQGDVCNDQGKTAWKCEFILNCPQIGDFKKNRPSICKFEGIDPIICCPPASQNTSNNNNNSSNSNNNNNNDNITDIINFLYNNKSPVSASKLSAQEVCRIMVKNICIINNYENVQTEIPILAVYGGKPALPREHKHMVLIGYGGVDRKSWECGGSLLTERWVLSAAHCASSYFLGPARWARVGDLDTSTTNDDARPQDKVIVERIIHPNYKEPAVYNDVALFKLDSDVLLNSWVAPICLHTEEEINVPKATVTGWGRLEFAGDVSAKLQEAQVTLVNGTECRRAYSNDTGSKIPEGIDTQSMICAGEQEGGKDACSGDSGGPLVIEVPVNCLKTQIGVISFGKDCGLPNTPGVYTKVSHFVPWIESIVWPR